MANPESSISVASWPQDSLSDTRSPENGRKITACEACRKQKIRCHLLDSKPPCGRCKKKGLSCTVNRPLQTLVEIDVAWKQAIEEKIRSLEERISVIANGDNNASPLNAPQSAQRPDISAPVGVPFQPGDLQRDFGTATEEVMGLRIVVDLESSPGTLPGRYLYPTAPVQLTATQDVISRGIITVENARKYQRLFQERLDHFIYGILGDHSTATFEDIREKSPFLSTAVCAVGALHLASPDYQVLYKEYITLSAAMSFSRRHTTDDIRALCVGAFWLSDLSSSLVSFAVRIATELQLYRSFSRVLQGDREDYLRTRLYYLVYACDHHLSIPHGRPPISRESEAVRNARNFLECKYAGEDDARLVSQVLRWSVCTRIYDTLGSDVDRRLSDDEVPKVRRFSIALDSLRAEWADRFIPNSHVGNYPRKGVGIQHHFAKLYLFSHALRGLVSGQTQHRAREMDIEVDEIASSAVLSAVSILRTVVSDLEIQSYLNGLPAYFHVMIAFATTFLLKVTTRFSASIQLDMQEVRGLLSKLIEVLQDVSKMMHPHHLLITIVESMKDLLERNLFAPAPAADNTAGSSPQQRPAWASHNAEADQVGPYAGGGFNQSFFDDYDFFVNYVQEPRP